MADNSGNNVGDDLVDDVGNRDNGGDDAGNNASKGDGRDVGKEGGGAPGKGRSGGSGSSSGGGDNCGGGGCILLESFPFYCEDIFGWYFYVWGNWQGHTSPHTLVTLEICRRFFWMGSVIVPKNCVV